MTSTPTLRTAMPQQRASIGRWAQRMTFTLRTQSIIDDGLVNYTEEDITFRGVLQPLAPKEIMLKPEGQRAWTWLRLQCFSKTRFNVNDQVTYNGTLYKIMAESDYTLSGSREYHVVRDYQTP
jgi:hypothetical protein